MQMLCEGRQVFIKPCSAFSFVHQRGELTPAHFFADVEEIPLHAADRIVYQRSSYADSAYLRFAELLSSPRASYTHSFQGACEEVYNGLCEYCILPLENSSEGQLNTFSRLIDRYGLKIAATAEIVASDGLRSTRFALLRKNLLPILRYGKRNYFFEFSVPLSQSPSSAEILLSAQLCGLRLYRVDTRSGQDPGRQSIIRYVFHAESNALTAFLLYLCMTAPHYEAAGIYPHLAAQSTE